MTKNTKIKFYKGLDRGKWAESKLDEIFPSLPNSVVSDIGAGFGWFGSVVKKRGLEWQAFDQIQKTKDIQIWDLNYPAPKQVKLPGLIVFLEVIEHLSNPELALKNITNHLSPGGYLIMSSPNPFYCKSKFDMIFKNQLYAFQPKHLREHHVFVPLPHVVEMYLKKQGFEMVEYAIIGKASLPEFFVSFKFVKKLLRFLVEYILGIVGRKQALGHTQGFVFKKIE